MDLFTVIYKLFEYLRSEEIEICSVRVLETAKINRILSHMEKLGLDKPNYNSTYENFSKDKINQTKDLTLNLSNILNTTEESDNGRRFHPVTIDVKHSENSEYCINIKRYLLNYKDRV